MIVSFEIENIDDLNLLLQLTKRLGIKQVEANTSNQKSMDTTTEFNDEINDIFGNSNIDLFI